MMPPPIAFGELAFNSKKLIRRCIVVMKNHINIGWSFEIRPDGILILKDKAF
jgi:hypothetical protein